MAVTVTHAHVGTAEDDPASEINKDEWNAAHVVSGLAAADIAFTPAGSIAATDVQAAIEEVAAEAGGGGVLYAQVTISNAEVLDWHATPVELVAAPGAGFRLQAIGASVTYVPGAVDFSTSGGTLWITGGNALLVAQQIQNDSGASFPSTGNSPKVLFFQQAMGGGYSVSDAEDQPLTIGAGQAFEDGDGTAIVDVAYIRVAVP